MSVPFLHLAFLAVAGLAFAGLGRLRIFAERRWAALLVCLAIAAIAAAIGLVPWIGDYQLTAYGLCLLLAFIAAYLIAVARAGRIGLNERRVAELFLVAIIAGVVGARARFAWENWAMFARDADGAARPWPAIVADVADFDAGGMVFYGGFILAAIAILAVARWRRTPLLPLADAAAPAALAGLAIGRLGCWFNGCCYGAACDWPWAVRRLPDLQPIHPTQLYEALAASGLALLLIVADRRPRSSGLVAAWACIGYGAWRFFNEGLRGDHHPGARTHLPLCGDISTSQATSLGLIVIGLALGARAWARRRRDVADGVSAS